MIMVSGEASWRSFYWKYAKIVRKCRDLSPGFYNQLERSIDSAASHYKSDFHAWCSLTDVEMLLQILLLPHSRVLVYCGGYHAANITKFLKKEAGFVPIYEYNYRRDQLSMNELDQNHLWPLEYAPHEPDAPRSIYKKKGVVQRFTQFFTGLLGRK